MKKLLTLPLLALCTSALSAEEKPNILIIIVDDAGHADFGFMGSKDIRTPNIDALAAQGTVFTDAHVAASVSSPSRAMLLTGRYGQRFGYECNLDEETNGLPQNEHIIPYYLKDKGYYTTCVGKWHLGAQDFQHPNNKGFDDFYGILNGSRSYFYNSRNDKPGSISALQFNGKQVEFKEYFTDELTKKAKSLVSKSTEPFMMYLAYTAPHTPIEPKKEDLELFKGHPRAEYAAMLWAADRGVGEVINELKRTGKFDNTVIFFISDNGGATNNGSTNTPYKGFKGNKFEGGQRVPFFVVWGDKFKTNERFKGLTSSLDIFATIADITDISKDELSNKIDGVSLVPYLEGKKSGNPHETLYFRKMDSRAIRENDYKLIITQSVDTVMYNLAEDISEMHDLMDSEPKIANKLMKKLSKWEENECIEPTWIENGWAPITNGLHRRLMHNEITTAQDLIDKPKNK